MNIQQNHQNCNCNNHEINIRSNCKCGCDPSENTNRHNTECNCHHHTPHHILDRKKKSVTADDKAICFIINAANSDNIESNILNLSISLTSIIASYKNRMQDIMFIEVHIVSNGIEYWNKCLYSTFNQIIRSLSLNSVHNISEAPTLIANIINNTMAPRVVVLKSGDIFDGNIIGTYASNFKLARCINEKDPPVEVD